MTEKIKIQEVLVVEGKDDTANLRRFYEVDTYETRGSAINEDDLERIAKLHELRGVRQCPGSRKFVSEFLAGCIQSSLIVV